MTTISLFASINHQNGPDMPNHLNVMHYPMKWPVTREMAEAAAAGERVARQKGLETRYYYVIVVYLN